MKYPIYLLAVALLLSSCASIMNGSHSKTRIYTLTPAKVVYKKDTLKTYNNELEIFLPRKKEVVNLRIVTESADTTITIWPRSSTAYALNFFTNWGIGALVDMKKSKRYQYPRKLLIGSSRKTDFLPKIAAGSWDLHISLPHANHFYFQPEDLPIKNHVGFIGIAAGVDYFYKENRFLSFQTGTVTDFELPFPAPIHYELGADVESLESTYFIFTNNYNFKRFTLGYGLSFARNSRKISYYEPFPGGRTASKLWNVWGLALPAYYKTGQHFRIGLIYRPTFYRQDSKEKFLYEHLITLDLAWKIRLSRP